MNQEHSTVMFTGNVMHKLDPKSRVAVPANWLGSCDGAFLLIDAQKKGYQIVKCYTPSSFAEVIAYIRRKAEEMQASPREIDEYVGDIIGRSYEAEASTQGKLLIPKKQRETLRLADTATLVGRGDYFEIWNPDDFEAANAPETFGKSRLDQHFGMLFT